jgi:general secretion pathway protein A
VGAEGPQGAGGISRDLRARQCAGCRQFQLFASPCGSQELSSDYDETRPSFRVCMSAIVDRGRLMYEAFYKLEEKPFSILPDPDLIYWGRTHRLAFTMLEFGVMNHAQFTVITGDVGSGKTTLVRLLLKRLDPRKTNVGLISNTPQGREELLQWIMVSLNLPQEGTTPALIKRFQDFLYAQHAAGRRTILIVDEAQNLGEQALEGLRMLSNINVDKDQYLQLILVGQPQLKEMLCRPQLLQIAQRVSSDFHLKPLDKNEVSDYIGFRLAAVGSKVHLFTHEACIRIAEASHGVPRMINILCDTALIYGFSAGVDLVTSQLVHDVIEDKRNFGIFPVNGSVVRV